MAQEVVAAQGLLDHHQPEAVELGEVIEVGRRVGAVGVGHQRRPAAHRLAHRGEVVDVGAGPDLDLRLAVALGEGAAHRVDEPPGRVLDADGDARRNLRARAPEKGGQADPGALGREHPYPHLDRRLRHVVAAHRRLEPGMQGLGACDRLAEGQRGDPLADGEPRGVDGLGREIGALAGHALRPRDGAVGVAGLEEEDAPEVGGAGRDAERLDKGHADLAQGDGLESDAHAGGTVPGQVLATVLPTSVLQLWFAERFRPALLLFLQSFTEIPSVPRTSRPAHWVRELVPFFLRLPCAARGGVIPVTVPRVESGDGNAARRTFHAAAGVLTT